MAGANSETRFTALKTFLASLDAGPENIRLDLLTSDAGYLTFQGAQPGHEAILRHLGTLNFDDVAMATATAAGDALVLSANGRSGGGGAVLTFQFAAGKIATVQSQPLPPKETSVAALKLPPQLVAAINRALEDRRPIVIAYVNAAGQPVMTYRGSLNVLSDTQLGIWSRNAEGSFISSIRERPKVALMYRNNEAREQFHFEGRARLANESERLDIYNGAPAIERGYDAAKNGTGVVIDLDAVNGFFRTPEGQMLPVKMTRDA